MCRFSMWQMGLVKYKFWHKCKVIQKHNFSFFIYVNKYFDFLKSALYILLQISKIFSQSLSLLELKSINLCPRNCIYSSYNKFDNSKYALFFTFYIKLLSVSQWKSRKKCAKSKYRLLRKLRADSLRRIEVLLKSGVLGWVTEE